LRDKITPKIGTKKINEITRGNIRDLLIYHGGKGAAASSISLILCVISGVMRHAIDDEIIQTNPAEKLAARIHTRKKQRHMANPLSNDEEKAALAYIKSTWPELYPFFLCAFRTGMRLGELCAIKWTDVNFNDRTISVSSTAKDQHIQPNTKTNTSRVIDMSNQLHDTLKKHKKTKGNNKFVFMKNGKLMPQATIRRRWNKTTNDIGIGHRRLHDIRHTFASRLLGKCAPINYVSNQLGHSNPHITLTVYAHFIPADNKKIINMLDIW